MRHGLRASRRPPNPLGFSSKSEKEPQRAEKEPQKERKKSGTVHPRTLITGTEHPDPKRAEKERKRTKETQKGHLPERRRKEQDPNAEDCRYKHTRNKKKGTKREKKETKRDKKETKWTKTDQNGPRITMK